MATVTIVAIARGIAPPQSKRVDAMNMATRARLTHAGPLSVCLIPPPFPHCSLSNPISSEFYTSAHIMPWIHHAVDIYQ
eukprot:974864-Amorphochlora_amoeboformis.AAC.1